MPKRLDIGILDENIYKDYFFMNDVMHCMNSTARKVTTYKYAFFKSILDNLFNVLFSGDGYYHLEFKYLSYTFSKIYWNLTAKHNVPQIHNNRQNTMVVQYNKLKEKYNIEMNNVDFDVIKDDIRNEYLKSTSSQITKDVLYALYADFNKRIYGYYEKEGYIYFSKRSYQFLLDYKEALEKINFYAWIKWTENILSLSHKNISNLSQKLDEEPERIALNKFKEELLGKGDELKCFYCGKSLKDSKLHVDHFIPWSFIKNNQSWNFVFSCPTCNEKKNDRIPSEIDLKRIIERNKRIFKESFEDSLRKSYEAALHNGFIIWNK